MTAELRKLFALPTPRWTLAATIAAVAIAALVSALAGPGDGADMIPVQYGVGLATSLAGIVLGAWMIGLEYGQKTIRRALTADPGRPRLVLAKLAVVLGSVTAVTVVVFAVSAPVFSAIASAHDESMPISDTLRYGLAGLFNNLVYATVAFALTLAVRSMAGGVALALGFTFVIDSALSAIPAVGDYTLSTACLELMERISGNGLEGFSTSDPNLARALVVTFAWVGVLVLVSFVRFVRTDVD